MIRKEDVQISTLDEVYNIAEKQGIAFINGAYQEGSRQHKWAVQELSHVLTTIDKWCKTLEIRHGRVGDGETS